MDDFRDSLDDSLVQFQPNGRVDDGDDDDDDDVEEQQRMEDHSNFSSSLDEEDKFVDEKEKVIIANTETRRVGCLRIVLALVLTLVAASVSLAVYASGRSNEQNKFETHAREACEKVTSSFQSSAASRLAAIGSLAKSISSNAAAQGQTWPNVIVPDFEERVSLTLDLAEVVSIALIPVVTGETLAGWNQYSVENQGWLQESLDYQRETGTNHSEWEEDLMAFEELMGSTPVNTIPDGVFRITGNGSFVNGTVDEGPFLPWWQFAPFFPVSSVVNYDTSSNADRQYQLRSVLESQRPLVSEAWDYSDKENYGRNIVLNLFLRQRQDGGKRYQDGPVSDLYYPIFDRSNDNDSKVAAVLTAYVYWQVYFENVLPSNTERVVAVLENICGQQRDAHKEDSGDSGELHYPEQQFSYEVFGEDAAYIGPGDLHDRKYDYLEKSTGWHAFLVAAVGSPAELNKGQCVYRVRVYPTQEMEDKLITNAPLYFMLVLLSTFAGTSLIFLLYDHYVERRQKVVLTKAIKSTEVLQDMFPENVRDRLFDESDGTGPTSPRKRSPGTPTGDSSSTDHHTSVSSIEGDHSGGPSTTMVADLYDNCTVLFADLAGFTSWASEREPTHVFCLLETLYGAFDRIAKRRGVFKVETIGDCYLAITGVPRPQKDHAVIMTKFAIDCMEKMNYLIQSRLVHQLGEETAELKLRVGLHSGSVTAGVLRSDRARFQLFGDTVNTASRMESLSLPGKIQASQETADLLVEGKKGAWLMPREGGVEAKGKGSLATFWVHPRRSVRTRAPASTFTSSVSTADTTYRTALGSD